MHPYRGDNRLARNVQSENRRSEYKLKLPNMSEYDDVVLRPSARDFSVQSRSW